VIDEMNSVGIPMIDKVRALRSTVVLRFLLAATILLVISLSLLTAHAFVEAETLQIAALWSLGAAGLSFWIAILFWRIPVLSQRTIGWFGGVWAVGIGISVRLVLITAQLEKPAAWELAVDLLALTISLSVGGLFLRALLRKRTSPLAARLISLVSPLAILLLILLLPTR